MDGMAVELDWICRKIARLAEIKVKRHGPHIKRVQQNGWQRLNSIAYAQFDTWHEINGYENSKWLFS